MADRNNSFPPSDATYHWAPTSFDLTSDFTYAPYEWDCRWHALEKTITEVKPRAVLSLLPATLGMGPLFASAMSHTKTLGMTLTLGNPDAAQEIMKQLGADFVIARPETALKFFAELPAAILAVQHLYLVVDSETADIAVPYRMNIVRDLHRMPAVSLGI